MAEQVAAAGAVDGVLEPRISRQAVAEGHDADLPTDVGYIPSNKTEQTHAQDSADPQRRRASSSAQRSSDIEKQASAGESTGGNEKIGTALDVDDPNIVFWDGPDDPENPYNWPTWRKVVICALISFLTLLTPLGSSFFAPGVPQVMQEFESSSLELAAFVVSVYVLGFAAGPLIMAPFSEIWGRSPVYHACNIGFVVFVVACAKAPSLNALIVFRLFSGIFGSAPLTNGGGTIADMVSQENRGAAMAAFSLGPLLGPVIGPVAGGFLSQAKGWRWVFWILAIVAGFTTIMMLLFMPETFAPVLLNRKTKKLRKQTGNQMLRSKLDAGLSPADYIKRGIVRPLRLLFFSPITLIFALYMAVVYSYLYLLFTSMTEVFEEFYGFSTGTVGLSFLGIGVGSLMGLGIFSSMSDRYVKKRAAESESKEMKPEYRLQLLPYGAIIMPAGFFIYGWTAEKHVHWIVPIIGTMFIGIGNLLAFMAISLYLVDAFTIYAASALAANTVARSIAGAVLPLAGLKLYARLGLGWGNSLLGFIALILIPVPFVILRYGEHLRKTYAVKNL